MVANEVAKFVLFVEELDFASVSLFRDLSEDFFIFLLLWFWFLFLFLGDLRLLGWHLNDKEGHCGIDRSVEEGS